METEDVATEVAPEQGLALYEAKAIEKINPLLQKFEELKETYKTAPDLSTAKGRAEMREHIRAFRDFKIDVEEERTAIAAKITQLTKTVNGKYNGLWALAEKEQKDRDATLKAKEKEDARIKKEKEEAEERLFLTRQSELTKLGVLFSEGQFVLGDFKIDLDLIKSSSDNIWENEILKGFLDTHAASEAERQEAERLRQEAEEKQRQEAEYLRLRQVAFEKEQKAFAEQQAAFIREKEEREKAERDQIAKERNTKLYLRVGQLEDTTISSSKMVEYKGIGLFNTEYLIDMDENAFADYAANHNHIVAVEKQEAEDARLAEIERQRIEKEKDTLEEVRRIALIAIGVTNGDMVHYDLREMPETDYQHLFTTLKLVFDEKQKQKWLAEQERIREENELREKERQADLSDKQKWYEWRDKLTQFAADMPTFKTMRYNNMKAIAQEKFGEIQLLKSTKISTN